MLIHFISLFLVLTEPNIHWAIQNKITIQDQYTEYFSQGMQQYNSGDYSRAIALFEKALEAKPEDMQATMMIEKCKHQKTNSENQKGEQQLTILKMAVDAFAKENYREALQYFEKYKKINPQDSSVDEKIKICKEKIGG